MVWFTVQLLPKGVNMNVQGVPTDCIVGPPYEIDQFAAAEYLGRLPHERRENGEGFGGKFHLSSGNFHFVSISIQFDGADLIVSSTHGIAPSPPQIGADPTEQKTMPISQIMDAVHSTLQIRYTLVLGIETA